MSRLVVKDGKIVHEDTSKPAFRPSMSESVTPKTRSDPQCLAGSFEQPGCAANKFKSELSALKQQLAEAQARCVALEAKMQDALSLAHEIFRYVDPHAHPHPVWFIELKNKLDAAFAAAKRGEAE